MIKKIIVIIVCVLLPFLGAAQHGMIKKDSSWHSKGFDFMMGGGIYFGNKYNAGYYNGSANNECNLNYIFGNKYWYDDINKVVIGKNPFISDSVFLGEIPLDMSYKPSMNITFGVKYKLNKNWGISLMYSFSRLIASDVFTLNYKMPPGNLRPGYLLEHLIGKENRSTFDLSVCYLFHPHYIVKPFLELGLQFNYVDVQSFYALIEDKEFNLLDPYGGENYVPGTQMTIYNTKFGGPGFGLSLCAGLKIAFSKYVSIDPTFYFSASSFGLSGYKKMACNYAAVIRIVMSDVVFMK
ncbi:MAG: hypothetical protein RR356_07515 [Bacteroidales bacterium]